VLGNQLRPLNSTGAQNLYGVDLVQHYAEIYFPTVAQGLDLKVGRFYCPFGVEATEAVSTPLLSPSSVAVRAPCCPRPRHARTYR